MSAVTVAGGIDRDTSSRTWTSLNHAETSIASRRAPEPRGPPASRSRRRGERVTGSGRRRDQGVVDGGAHFLTDTFTILELDATSLALTEGVKLALNEWVPTENFVEL